MQKKNNAIGGVIFLVLVAIGAIWFIHAATSSSPIVTTTTGRTNDTSSSQSNAPTPPPPAPAPAPQVLLDLSGSGTKQTEKFSTSGDWTLTYNYDCSMLGSQGNFQVFIYNDDGSIDNNDTLVNQLGANGSDTENYYDSGVHYLAINSECSWRVTARE